MNRNLTSACLIVCMVCFTSTQWASAADVQQSNKIVRLKQTLEFFGIGANVKVKLADGQRMKGQIASIDGDGFALTSNGGAAARQISYDKAAELTLVTKKYHASGVPDASEARRVVAGLGIGTHVMVRTGESKIHGQIRTIEGDHFLILPDDKADPVAIAYQDVRQVGKNLGILSTIGLVAVIVVAIVVIAKVK
jgi:ribosome maturation factor RimP